MSYVRQFSIAGNDQRCRQIFFTVKISYFFKMLIKSVFNDYLLLLIRD